jgi:hypothetical protein
MTTTITPDQTFGHWRVLRITYRRALCRCRCGAVHEVSIAALQDGSSASCGCSPRSLVSVRVLNEARAERQRNTIFNWRLERGR